MKPIRSLTTFLIDATASFFIFQIVALGLAYFYFLPFFPSFFVIWLLYYLCCYILNGTTLGLSFFNSYLDDIGNKRSYIIRVILRECFTSFPAVVLWLFAGDSIVLLKIALIVVICLALTIWRKRLFKMKTVHKEQLCSTSTSNCCQRNSRHRILGLYGGLIVLGTGSFCINTYLTGDKIILNEKPIALRPRPAARLVSKYTDFINTDSKDINEYIKELYNTMTMLCCVKDGILNALNMI